MRFVRLAEKLNDWCDLQDTFFVAEDTLLSVYSNGLFAGALHWSIVSNQPLSMIVSMSDDPRHADKATDLRLYLIRTLSALLPAYVQIRGSNIKI